MPQASDLLKTNIRQAVETFEQLGALGTEIDRAADLLVQRLKAGHKLLICGNGGSSADASHIAAEFVGRFVHERRGFPAIALTDAPGTLTAVSNDYGFDHVFARQIEALGNPNDVLIAISTSGNSPNILNAIHTAKTQGLSIIALLGRDGGKAKGLADIDLIAPHTTTARIQEAHQLLYHTLCEAVDNALSEQPR